MNRMVVTNEELYIKVQLSPGSGREETAIVWTNLQNG